MHWAVSLPSKTPALPLFCQGTHKSENRQSPPPSFPFLLANLSLYILFFAKLCKIKFFSKPHNIKNFSSLTSCHLLKV